MPNNPSPLALHYETNNKLDYFILTADIALLWWTVVNTDWLPNMGVYIWLMGVFWFSVIISVVSGIVKQMYNSMMFGVNHQFLQAWELANTIERTSFEEGANFIDQSSWESISSQDFKQYAVWNRKSEEKWKEEYKKYSKKSTLCFNLSIVFLVIALIILVWIKIQILTIK